jgi:hypothetical protein
MRRYYTKWLKGSRDTGNCPYHRVKYWEAIADNLSKAGFSWGCVATVDRQGRTIWVADAHRDNGKRYVVHADEKLTAFAEIEAAIRRRSPGRELK